MRYVGVGPMDIDRLTAANAAGFAMANSEEFGSTPQPTTDSMAGAPPSLATWRAQKALNP